MIKTKKLLSVVLAFLMVISFVACGKGNDTSSTKNKQASTGWISGEPSAPGDVFSLPKIDSSKEKVPIIAELTKQVSPGNSITVTGEGFSKDGIKAFVFAQTTKSDAKTFEAPFTVVDDTTMMITVDEKAKYGIYGIYLQSSDGTSNVEFVNRPKIWWTGLTAVTGGTTFSIYGENLTHDNADNTNVFLLNDKSYRQLSVKYADPYKVTVEVPDDLEDGSYYEVRLHNGHGGEYGWASATEKIVFYKDEVNTWNDTVINVTDYGANPADDGQDDSAAIQSAVAEAKDGDTVYIPAGTYLCSNSIITNVYLQIKGEGADKVKLIVGDNIKNNEGIFNINVSPTEIFGICFEDIRTTPFKGSSISAKGDECISESYNLSIHNCRFIQDTRPSLLSKVMPIIVQSMSSVLIYDNKFESAGFLWANRVQKLFVNNNDFCGMCYVGKYYGQGPLTLWGTDMVDASSNKFYGQDILTDDTGILNKGDRTCGRTFALQQSARNFYIANNSMKRTGLPDDNAGEQIMLEDIQNVFNGSVVSADENSITIPQTVSLKKNSIVSVVSGKGVSQWRYVKKVKGTVITLSEPWDIVPDSNSRIIISKCFDNFAIYKNEFDGFVNHSDAPTATCAVQIYGNTHNMFITNNVMKNLAYGVCVTSHYICDPDREHYQNVVYWSQIDNNTIDDVNIGIKHILAKVSPVGTGDIPARTSIGVVERNNSFSNVKDFTCENKKTLGGAGILLGTASFEYVGQPNRIWNGQWEYGTLIENNSFKDCSIANVLLYNHQGGTVLKGNKASGTNKNVCTVTSGGSKPIEFN